MQLPDYNFLSAPLWLVTALHIITLTLHLVAMNFLFGGIIVVLWGRFTNKWQHPVVQRFLRLFPIAMAATVTFGVAPLLFVQLTYHGPVYSASIISGWFWLMIIPAVIWSYYFLYAAAPGSTVKRPKRLTALYLGLALVGLAYVSYIYSSVFSLAEKPDLYKELYVANQAGTALNPEIGNVLLRWLHTMLGALTVGGFFVGVVGRHNDEAFRIGKTFFLYGMVAASLLGFAYLLSFGELMSTFMKSPAIWILTIGVILSAGSLHFFFKKKWLPSALMLFTSVVTMVLTRHIVRQLKFGDQWNPATIPVQPQWDVFALFIFCFLLAIGLIWYMLRLFFLQSRSAEVVDQSDETAKLNVR